MVEPSETLARLLARRHAVTRNTLSCAATGASCLPYRAEIMADPYRTVHDNSPAQCARTAKRRSEQALRPVIDVHDNASYRDMDKLAYVDIRIIGCHASCLVTALSSAFRALGLSGPIRVFRAYIGRHADAVAKIASPNRVEPRSRHGGPVVFLIVIAGVPGAEIGNRGFQRKAVLVAERCVRGRRGLGDLLGAPPLGLPYPSIVAEVHPRSVDLVAGL